jgi:IS1 family transposase
MNFGMVQSGMLAGLIALSIPYIIHLMFKQKPREVQMGSVRFLREIMERHRNRKKIMRWLLMALRMACIALIALMFARPFLSELRKSDGNERLVVVLIDKSASMQLMADGVSLTAEAVAQTREIIRDADDNTKFEIAFFDHQVHPLLSQGEPEQGSNESKTTSRLLQELKVPEPGYSATDYATAFRWAHDICVNSKSDLRQLHVFTDLQQSGLAWSDVEPMPKEVKVNVHDLGRDLPNNIAITESTPERLVVRPRDSTSVEVAILNSGPFALEEVPVKLDLKNGTRTIHKREKVKLEPGSVERVEFQLPELEIGTWEGSVSVETIDDLSFDNLRHVAVLAKPQYRVLVVGGDEVEQDFLSETHHLQSALRLAPSGKSYAESPYLVTADSVDASFSDFDVIVLANVESVSTHNVDRIRKFVESGKGLIVFGGDKVTSMNYESLGNAGLIPGKLLGFEEAIDIPWRIDNWDKSSSIFAPFNDPQHGDLRQLAFRGLVNIEPAKGANVVASFRDEKPFVVEQGVGDQGGGVIWISTSCGNRWSNWTRSNMYLPVVHQMLGHLTGLNQGGPLQEALIDTNSGELASDTPGIFEAGKAMHVVNVSPRESETERCSVSDFASRFELNIGDQEIGSPAAKVRRASFSSAFDVRQNEIWHWILFALVTLGTVEFFIANRTVA